MPRKSPGPGEAIGLEHVQAAVAGATWTAAENPISGLSIEEKALRLGYVPGPDHPSLEERERIAQANVAAAAAAAATAPPVGYPASHDWRNVGGNNFITPVRDQGGCGSCVAFGTIATVEGTARVRRDNPSFAIDLSEAQLFYCYGAAAGRTCQNGWWPDGALNAIRDQGVVDEACFPYTAGNQPCNLCADWKNRLTKISAWHAISSTNDMRAWLATHGPLATCFTVYEDFFYYKSGVYTHQTGNAVGGHCVSVVGYDDINQYWICKNSWGTGFGESGFFRIAYGQCGIDGTMWAVEDAISPPGRTEALYRYWNPSIGDHFYTTNWNELGSGKYGWGFEGIQCYVNTQQAQGTVPLYRYWNPSIGDHFYTTNWNELGSGKYGWGFEGIQCYVYPAPATGTLPLYRYWNPGIGDHFYTTSWDELGRGASGWNFESIQCYVLTGEAATTAAEGEAPETFRSQPSGAGFSGMPAGAPLSMAPPSFRTSESLGGGVPPTSFAPTARQGVRLTLDFTPEKPMP